MIFLCYNIVLFIEENNKNLQYLSKVCFTSIQQLLLWNIHFYIRFHCCWFIHVLFYFKNCCEYEIESINQLHVSAHDSPLRMKDNQQFTWIFTLYWKIPPQVLYLDCGSEKNAQFTLGVIHQEHLSLLGGLK